MQMESKGFSFSLIHLPVYSDQPAMKILLVLFAAVALQTASAQGIPKGEFVEEKQPFFRSALIVSEKPMNRVRRGILLPLGEGYWTCFDPDLLRYAAIWKAPAGKAPLSMDSMAGVSYPDKKAKAYKPPALRGKIISQTKELPGVGLAELPDEDIRELSLTVGKGRVGPLPVDAGRYLGLLDSKDGVVLSYRIGSRVVRETSRVIGGDLIERLIAVAEGKESVAIGLDGALGIISGSVSRKILVLESGGMKHLSITGQGRFDVVSSAITGTSVVVAGGGEEVLFRIIRSAEKDPTLPKFGGFPENEVGSPPFPDTVEVSSPAGKENKSPLAERPLGMPLENPENRAVRPTDIAFLSNGDALITTLDGDVWRVKNIGEEMAIWSRVASGIFEAMSIAIGKDNAVFVLGRDQITRLEDTNEDGFFDLYACASDAFPQTLHTRDYATSLEVEEDGSFVIVRAGLVDGKNSIFGELAPGRGSVSRISPDGLRSKTLADGLRVPYVGKRADGALFISDQQGEYTPSTPIHLLGDDEPFLGYAPADFREKKAPKPPLLWFPYQINRSGSAFAMLSEKGFPSLGNSFVHLSWSGRIFPVETPEKGLPFAWKLPFDFDFPILGAATHPQNGRLYATGIGISGYLPQTPKESGLAEIFEKRAMVAPISLEVESTRLTVTFRDPLPSALSLIAPRPELDLWNIKRTGKYGSGHFQWDGKPGEHAIHTGKITFSPNREKMEIEVPEIFKSDILRLRLHIRDTSVTGEPYVIELYTLPDSLSDPSKSDLAAVAKREQKSEVALTAGDATLGKNLFTNYGCTGCHALDGTKLTGPSSQRDRHPPRRRSGCLFENFHFRTRSGDCRRLRGIHAVLRWSYSRAGSSALGCLFERSEVKEF